jgi:6-phosphogluconolactonase
MHHKKREVLISHDIDEMSDCALQKWEEICSKAVKNKGSFEVALSGGKTPGEFYQKLGLRKKTLPWNKTQIFFVDERFVSFDDAESNYRMIDKMLLSHISIPRENIHPIPTNEDTPYIAAEKYEKELSTFFKLKKTSNRSKRVYFPKFDLIMLGVGEDGHTASLFTGTPSLSDTRHLVIAVSPVDVSKKDRITITFPVINCAENIIFFIAGSNKSQVMKEILEGDKHDLPASMVDPTRGRVLFLLDEGAASQLSFVRK